MKKKRRLRYILGGPAVETHFCLARKEKMREKEKASAGLRLGDLAWYLSQLAQKRGKKKSTCHIVFGYTERRNSENRISHREGEWKLRGEEGRWMGKKKSKTQTL